MLGAIIFFSLCFGILFLVYAPLLGLLNDADEAHDREYDAEEEAQKP